MYNKVYNLQYVIYKAENSISYPGGSVEQEPVFLADATDPEAFVQNTGEEKLSKSKRICFQAGVRSLILKVGIQIKSWPSNQNLAL